MKFIPSHIEEDFQRSLSDSNCPPSEPDNLREKASIAMVLRLANQLSDRLDHLPLEEALGVDTAREIKGIQHNLELATLQFGKAIANSLRYL